MRKGAMSIIIVCFSYSLCENKQTHMLHRQEKDIS